MDEMAAAELIRRAEALRAPQHVPFYIHEPTERFAERELALLEGCGEQRGLSAQSYQYGGEYHFIKQLVAHPWRTYEASAAALLVIPMFVGLQAHWIHHRGKGSVCPNRTSSDDIIQAVRATAVWRERPQDHIFVSLDPAMTPADVAMLASANNMFHGFVEAMWPADPLIESDRGRAFKTGCWPPPSWRRKDAASTSSHILVAPYVVSPRNMSRAGGWVSDEREIDCFFGGQTTTWVDGASSPHKGYYMRWSLFQQWGQQPSRFSNRTLLVTENSRWMLHDGVPGRHEAPVARQKLPLGPIPIYMM